MQNIFFIFLIYRIGASIELSLEEQSVSETNPMIHDSANKDRRNNTSQDLEENNSHIQRTYTSQEDTQSNVVIELENIVEVNKSENSSRLHKKTMLKNSATKRIENQGLLWKILVWKNGLVIFVVLVLLISASFTVDFFFTEKEDYSIRTLLKGFKLSIFIKILCCGWFLGKKEIKIKY